MENGVSELVNHFRVMADRFDVMADRFEVMADRNSADHYHFPYQWPF
jgi:hypothetical protein